MDTLKSLLESLKAATYGVLALLLPGAALIELLDRLVPIQSLASRWGTASYLALAYISGAAIQGVSSLLFGLKPLKCLTDTEDLREAEQHAQQILERKLNQKIGRNRV